MSDTFLTEEKQKPLPWSLAASYLLGWPAKTDDSAASEKQSWDLFERPFSLLPYPQGPFSPFNRSKLFQTNCLLLRISMSEETVMNAAGEGLINVWTCPTVTSLARFGRLERQINHLRLALEGIEVI